MKTATIAGNAVLSVLLGIGILLIAGGNPDSGISDQAAFKGFTGRFAAAELFGRSYCYRPACLAWTDTFLPALSKLPQEERLIVLKDLSSPESLELTELFEKGAPESVILDRVQRMYDRSRQTGTWRLWQKIRILSPFSPFEGSSDSAGKTSCRMLELKIKRENFRLEAAHDIKNGKV